MAVDFSKQTSKPLFPDILWNRPVSRKAARSLVIIGGHKTQFSATQSTYQAAVTAGIGSMKVLLPDSVRQFTGSFPDAVFLPSTTSGSLALVGQDQILEYIAASDGALIAGELSRNRETISLIERVLSAVKQPLAVSGEVVQGWSYAPQALLAQTNRLLIGEGTAFKQLQEAFGLSRHIKPETGTLNKLLLLEKLAQQSPAAYVLGGEELVVHSDHQNSVTSLKFAPPETASLGVMTTFWLQNPDQFKALTTAAFVLRVAAQPTEGQTLQRVRSFLKETDKF